MLTALQIPSIRTVFAICRHYIVQIIQHSPIKSGGFTVVELLIVITIIGILSTVIIPHMTHYPNMAKATATKAIVETTRNAISRFVLANHAANQGAQVPTYTEFNTPGVVLNEPIQPNPYNGNNSICDADNHWSATNPPIDINSTCSGYGWNYDQTHGRFWANSNQDNEHLY